MKDDDDDEEEEEVKNEETEGAWKGWFACIPFVDL